jgi:hypothetical protein
MEYAKKQITELEKTHRDPFGTDKKKATSFYAYLKRLIILWTLLSIVLTVKIVISFF